ncbi:hypothetical protein Cyrtocomes_00242 [Candidatus Cyrtobacter comes]|uniref:Transposase n=1 Tax=Candidatus Cyrtobacter comes TaxID=675776 RepID=A0ABU5L6X1_9RICK|nr:hypothetical protein [Candidatus Cyrtobacter comes]
MNETSTKVMRQIGKESSMGIIDSQSVVLLKNEEKDYGKKITGRKRHI